MPKKKIRSDGRYQGKLLVGVINGRQKYKYVYGKTKKEVDEKLAVLRVDLGKGADLTQQMSLAFWIDRWLSREEKKTDASNWFAVCRARALYWKELLGDRDVSKLTTADLEDVLLDLAVRNPKTNKPTSKKTLLEYKNLICRVYRYIMANRVITFDPSAYLETDQTAPQHRRTAVSEGVAQAIAATEDEIRLPCLIMLYAGLRLGEVLALTWSDVDLTAAVIRVNKSWDYKQDRIKTPKTAAGTRTVPIPPPLLAALTVTPRTALLVCPHNGHAYSLGEWNHAMRRFTANVGADFSAHNLRHTCCTMYYEAGVDVLTAQRWMGHANAATTMSIYTHLREQKEASNVTRLNAFFAPPPSAETSR